jgi:hypothetical protein
MLLSHSLTMLPSYHAADSLHATAYQLTHAMHGCASLSYQHYLLPDLHTIHSFVLNKVQMCATDVCVTHTFRHTKRGVV